MMFVNLLPRSLSYAYRDEGPVPSTSLVNFFESIRGNAKLNCPGEIGYETAVKVNEAIAAGRKIELSRKTSRSTGTPAWMSF